MRYKEMLILKELYEKWLMFGKNATIIPEMSKGKYTHEDFDGLIDEGYISVTYAVIQKEEFDSALAELPLTKRLIYRFTLWVAKRLNKNLNILNNTQYHLTEEGVEVAKYYTSSRSQWIDNPRTPEQKIAQKLLDTSRSIYGLRGGRDIKK